MKSVLISIRPKWVEKIASGEKTIEVRKTAPKETPFKAYIYCTKDKYDWLYRVDNNGRGKAQSWHGKVIGEFICDKVEVLFNTNGNPENYMTEILPTILQKTALSYDEFAEYVGSRADKNSIYGWHISDLKIYDKPKELSEFWGRKNCLAADTVECWNCFATCLEINGKHCQPLTRPPQSWCYIERS